MKYLLTIDPGVSGGWIFRNLSDRDPGYSLIKTVKFIDEKHAAAEIFELDQNFGLSLTAVVVEQVHASPVMSPSSAFSFGTNFGIWRGLMAAHSKLIMGITPHQWQAPWSTQLDGLEGSKRKSRLNQIAKEVYPTTHVTLRTCDALLLSHFCTMQHSAKGTLPGKFI